MKLLSGTASIAPKKFPLMAFAIATLGIGLPPAALAQTANAPRPKTEAALGCLLGMAPDGCQTVFVNARYAWRRTTYCTVEYTHRRLDNCSDGPLETVRYLGTDAAGADLYDVDYMNKYMTYILWPPAPDGRIEGFWIFEGPPARILGHQSLITITAPVKPAPTLYSRPEHGA